MTLPLLPDVFGMAVGGQLGLDDGDPTQELGIIGVCSAGPLGVRVLDRSSLTTLATVFGTGPLPRAIRDAFQAGAVVCKVLRCETEEVGVKGTVDTAAKEGTGTIGFTGDPLDEYEIVIKITFPGGLGTAKFRWSQDGGDIWSDELATASTVVLEGTGLTATFANAGGGPTAGNFLTDDIVRMATTAPSPTSTEVATAIDTFSAQAWNINAKGPHIILVAGETGDAVWQICQTRGAELHAAHKYVHFVCEARGPGPDGDEDVTEWVTALLAAKTATNGLYLSIIAARVELVDSLGYVREANAAASYCGRLMAIPAMESPARVKQDRAFAGPIPGARALRPAVAGEASVPVPSLTEAQIKALSDAGFGTARSFFGLGGVYWTDGRTAAAPSSDFATIERVRPALEALQATRLATLDELFGDTGPAGLRQIEAVAQAALDRLQARGRIPAARASVSLEQNVADQGYVAVGVFLQFTPTAKWIAIEAKWTRGLPATV